MTRYTPENITKLEPNEVFVFGSNRKGAHGKGAAKIAAQKFGAKYGTGTGLMGQSYGIATKGWKMEVLSFNEIDIQIKRFLRFAANHPELQFLVTKVGCGLAGFSIKEIAGCFCGETIPSNVSLPVEFWDIIAGV